MTEETRSSNSQSQIEEVWKQWYETSSKVWSDILAGTRETYADPYGLYRSWLKAVEDGQEAGKTIAVLDPGETWKKWFETTGDIWRKSQGLGTDPLGMTTRWIEVMEEARLKLLGGTANDPVAFFKQWYDSSNEVWSKALEEIIGTEKFVESANSYMESYTTFYKTFRDLNQEYFSHLQLTTRADLTRVAEIIVALENKVDWIQDAFEDFQDQLPQFATLESIRTLANHLESLEGKLQRLPEALQKIDTLNDLSLRLTSIEGTLGDLPPTLQKLDAIQGLDQRLHSIEGKLNKIPSTLQKLDAIQGLDQRLSGVEWHLGEIPPKLDVLQGLDQRLSNIESKSGEIAPALQKLDAIQGLDQRLGGVESKLNEVPSALQKLDAVQGLDQRLDGVEGRLNELAGTLEKSNATGDLEKRLDGVENKLDRLLSLLEEKETHQPAPTAPAKTPQRRAPRAKAAPKKAAETDAVIAPS